MLKRWGTKSLADVLREPIALADGGARSAIPRKRERRGASSTSIGDDHDVPPSGRRRCRPATRSSSPTSPRRSGLSPHKARTSSTRAKIAQAIVDATKGVPTKPIVGGEGRMTLADLASLHVRVEKPLSLDFHGATVLAPPPSTNGGLVLPRSSACSRRSSRRTPRPTGGGARSPSMHTTLESMRLSFADRDMWIGDPDVADVPAAGLLSDGYLTARSSLIGLECSSRIPVALPGDPRPYDASALTLDDQVAEPIGHTTHISMIDKWGNAVALTSTVADTFGSGIMVPGYGFELNDSLNLFNLTPKAEPRLPATPARTTPRPDKRPMGSMTPTIVVEERRADPRHGHLRQRVHPEPGLQRRHERRSTSGWPSSRRSTRHGCGCRRQRRPAERELRPESRGSRRCRRSTHCARSATSSRSRPRSGSARRARPASTSTTLDLVGASDRRHDRRPGRGRDRHVDNSKSRAVVLRPDAGRSTTAQLSTS